MTTTLKIPTNVFHIFKPCDTNNTHNPCCFHQTLIDRGWDEVFKHGLWNERSVDSLLPTYPNLFIMRPHGENLAPPISGYSFTGQKIECTPRGPQDIKLAETIVPGFWNALSSRIKQSHSLGGRVMVNYGTPPLNLFNINLLVAKRNALLDALILPAVNAGMGTKDYIVLDASSICSQKTKTQAMYFAERVLYHGIGLCVEAHEVIHPEYYPWYNGRFAALSARTKNLEYSRWDLINRDHGWFGPKVPFANKEHFCFIQGSEKVEDRLGLIEQGPNISTVLEFGGMEAYIKE